MRQLTAANTASTGAVLGITIPLGLPTPGPPDLPVRHRIGQALQPDRTLLTNRHSVDGVLDPYRVPQLRIMTTARRPGSPFLIDMSGQQYPPLVIGTDPTESGRRHQTILLALMGSIPVVGT